MGILGKQKVINYLSIPIVICGLFLTFLVDFVLYQEESRIGREVFTTTAFHRMNNLYEYVYRYETAAQIIDSSIRESGGRIDGIKGLGRLLEINRSFRLMELIPEEGESLSYKSDRWLGTGRSLLAGPLKKASEDAKASGKMVLVDSLELDHERTYILKSREIISISEMGLPSRHTEPSASLLFPKGDEPFPAVGKAQLYPNHPAMSASYTSCTTLSHPSAF